MNEITRIHLAKVAYDIEIDAKKQLERYVRDIEHTMSDGDMLYEVELRMVELLNERGVKPGGVIALDDVKSLQKTLGLAKDFGDDDDRLHVDEKSERKFFRDEANGMIGGVCSGLAAYFAVDVWLVRLAAIVLLVLTSGGIALAYLALMIFIPAAKSASDRLQMTGRATTIHAIKELVPSASNVSRMVQLVRNVVRVVGVLFMASIALGLAVLLALGIVATLTVLNIAVVPLAGMFIGIGAVGMVALIVAVIALAIMIGTMSVSRRMVKLFWASFATAVLLGTIGVAGLVTDQSFGEISQEKDVVVSKNLSLNDVKKLTIASGSVSSVPITYVVSSGQPRIETRHPNFLRMQPVEATTSPSGTDTHLNVSFQSSSPLCRLLAGVCGVGGEATVYGPALDSVTVAPNVYLKYKAKSQSSLQVTYQEGATPARLEIESLDTLKITAADMVAGSTEINGAKVGAIDIDSMTATGAGLVANSAVNAVNVQVRQGCVVGSSGMYDKATILYQSLGTITVQGQPLALPTNDQTQTTLACVSVQPIGRSGEAIVLDAGVSHYNELKPERLFKTSISGEDRWGIL